MRRLPPEDMRQADREDVRTHDDALGFVLVRRGEGFHQFLHSANRHTHPGHNRWTVSHALDVVERCRTSLHRLIPIGVVLPFLAVDEDSLAQAHATLIDEAMANLDTHSSLSSPEIAPGALLGISCGYRRSTI